MSLNQNLTIGQAVDAMKNGKRVARAGWNGKGMWIAIRQPYKGPMMLPDIEMDLPYVFMRTAQGDFVPWLCSQTDLLANDWEVVE